MKKKIIALFDNRWVQNVVGAIFGFILLITVGGWVGVYDISNTEHDWSLSDSILGYSCNLFAVFVFGLMLQILIWFFLALIAMVTILVCYHCWFIVLPLVLVFFGICAGRWIYVRKMRNEVKG